MGNYLGTSYFETEEKLEVRTVTGKTVFEKSTKYTAKEFLRSVSSTVQEKSNQEIQQLSSGIQGINKMNLQGQTMQLEMDDDNDTAHVEEELKKTNE